MSHINQVLNKRTWFSNVQADLLSGAVVALALIPEAIAFSIIAKVDPKVGIYASFCIAIITAFMGGRAGMISAATGAMALLFVPLTATYGRELGLEYILATTILTGIFQIILGYVRLGDQMRFVPRAVMVGFVNALAIVIFTAQFPQLFPWMEAGSHALEKAGTLVASAGDLALAGGGEALSYSIWVVYAMVAAGLAIIYGLPRITKLIPSPLVAIVVLTLVSMFGGLNIPTVGDEGSIPTTLPPFHLPQVAANLETFQIILPFALSLAIVGLMESFLTANVLDDFTDSTSDKNQEAKGQGLANIVAGFFGGMAGCAMVGQSVINVKSGGRTRLSTLTAGVVLLVIILAGSQWVSQIPMAALVAVMIMVSISTFSWASLRNIRLIPKSETAVTLATVAVTLLTHNLAYGVLTGVALSALFFSHQVADIVHVDSLRREGESLRTYSISGDIFFVSVEGMLGRIDFREEGLEQVTLDLTHAHIWDQTAVDAIDKVMFRFRKRGLATQLIGLDEASAGLLERLATHNKSGAMEPACH